MPELEVGHRRIWVRQSSDTLDPDRPTAVFVHGAGGSSLTWIYQIRALRRRVNCIAIDLPGHGRSTDDDSCTTVESYATVVNAAIEALNPTGTVVLVGHSMGGAIALEAIRTATRVTAIALFGVGPTIPVSPLLMEALRQTTDVWTHLMDDLLFSPTTPRRFVDKSTASGLQADRSVVLRDFQACADWQLGQTTLDQPGLLVAGRDDAMVPVPLAESLVMRFPELRLEVLDDAGHMAMLEQHKRTNELVYEFVTRQG